jgi:hypothetical protein
MENDMSNTKHTKTPWHYGPMHGWGDHCITRRPAGDYDPSGVIGDAPLAIVVEKAGHWENGYPVEANAAFIVRAVNSHEQLVAALKDARELLALNGIDFRDEADYGNGRASDIIERIDSALADAEA